jgi:hypothetical protein
LQGLLPECGLFRAEMGRVVNTIQIQAFSGDQEGVSVKKFEKIKKYSLFY